MVNGSRAKTGRSQTVKALFGRSKILTAVAALDTAPMGVTSPWLPSGDICQKLLDEMRFGRELENKKESDSR